MLSKTLLVCLLAFLCLNLASALRLDTRIAGANASNVGQFPYIAFLFYNYQDGANVVSQQFTGIIYSSNAIITTASSFANFPAGGSLTIQVGSYEINQPVTSYTLTPTIGTYQVDSGAAAPADLVVIPTQYAATSSNYNVAIVKLDPAQTPNTFDFTNVNIATANFPTSAPISGESFYAVAYGNQAPGGATFPALKFAQLKFNLPNKCQDLLAANSLTALDRSRQFCIRSVDATKSGTAFNGVCRLDVGGAVIRTTDPTPSTYYEVVGLIAYADDANTCNDTARVPAVINYLSVLQDGFFTPVAGALANNGQDATQNPNSNRGNFICGNGVVEGVEGCDPTDASTQPCCSPNSCTWKKVNKLCDGKDGLPQVCVSRKRCRRDHSCTSLNRQEGKECDASGSTCSAGVCGTA